MSTIKTYIKKSFKLVKITAKATTIFSLILYIFINFILRKFYFGLILIDTYSEKDMKILIVFFIFSYLLYGAYKFTKVTDSPSKEFLKMIPAAIFWICVVIYSSTFFIDDTYCQRYNYTEKLNGGLKEFQGKKYLINICASKANGGAPFDSGMDYAQLTVLSEHGEVLARRNYRILWDGQPGHTPIEIHQDSIRYQDDADTYGGPITLTMPPSKLDWIAARFPIFNLLIYP